jgi:glucose-1-phosphate adenylyltransferase
VLILSGDQLYSMDYRNLLNYHVDSQADVTVSCLPAPLEEVYRMGIMQIDEQGRIINFMEKPSEPEVQSELATEESFFQKFGIQAAGRRHLGSMGVYVFNREALIEMLSAEKYSDFGREVIPAAVKSHRVYAYVFDDFWEDIGTIDSYYRVNLSLTDPLPPFNFYKEGWPIFTHPRSLPGVKIVGGKTDRAIFCEGCIVDNAEITHSIIGVRQVVRSGAKIRDSLVLGADFYDSPGDKHEGFRQSESEVPLGVGLNADIEGAIIDKNARIGNEVKIRPKWNEPDQDGDGFYVRSGIVIIPRGGILEDGRVI